MTIVIDVQQNYGMWSSVWNRPRIEYENIVMYTMLELQKPIVQWENLSYIWSATNEKLSMIDGVINVRNVHNYPTLKTDRKQT